MGRVGGSGDASDCGRALKLPVRPLVGGGRGARISLSLAYRRVTNAGRPGAMCRPTL